MRYVSGAQSNAISGGGSNAPFPLYGDGIAGEAVSAGQLAVQRGDNKFYWACDPDLPGATLRPIAQASDIYLGLQSQPTLYSMAMQGRLAGGVLSNGNFFIAQADSAAPYMVRVKIYDPHGVPVFFADVSPSAQANGSGGSLVCAAVLSGGGFVVAYNLAGRPTFSILDNAGSVTKAATAMGGVSSTMYSMSISPLTAGGFAVCYNQLSVNEVPNYAVFSSAGAQVKAPTALRAAPASNATLVASNVAALTGGGFVCAYSINVGGSNTNYAQIFDATGTKMGAEIVVRAGATLNSGVLVRAFGNGGFCVVETDSVRVTAYDSTGVVVGIPLAKEAAGVVRNRLFVPTPGIGSIGFALPLIWHGAVQTTVYISPIYYDGISSSSVVVSTAALSSCELQSLGMYAFGGYVVACYADASSRLCVNTYNGSHVLIASAVYQNITSDLNGATATPYGFSAFVTSPLSPSTVTFVVSPPTAAGTATFAIVNSFVSKASCFGVYSASAATAATVAYQFAGTTTLATTFPRRQSIAIFPTGQLMHINGSKIFFSGVTL